MNDLNQREVVLFVKRLQLVLALNVFLHYVSVEELVDAFICFQKNGWENFSVNVLVSILGIAPSLGYDCLVFARRLHPVVQTTG